MLVDKRVGQRRSIKKYREARRKRKEDREREKRERNEVEVERKTRLITKRNVWRVGDKAETKQIETPSTLGAGFYLSTLGHARVPY